MSDSEDSINFFELNRISKRENFHPVIVIIGPRNTGKTTLLRWMLYHNRHKYATPLAVSKTADAQGSLRDHIPDLLIHKNYDPKTIKDFIAHQELLTYYKNKGIEPYKSQNIDALLVMDDILADMDWSKDENIRDLMFNGRQYKITVVITLQDPMALPRRFRGQIDFVFCFGAEQDAEKKRLYEYYWNSSFGNRETFDEVFDLTTIDYKCLVVDNSNKKTKKLSERIFYCKTKTVDDLPHFRLGSSSLWREHEERYDPEWFLKPKQSMVEDKKKKTAGPTFKPPKVRLNHK